MDTSETYIKMRIAAIPDLGRGKPLESTFRSDNRYKWETDAYSVFVDYEGDWYTFHPDIKFIEKQGRICQLERQDQLQEMVDYQFYSSLELCWAFAQSSNGWMFGSMEQLWLAFVMKEKHNKTLDGTSWN